VVAVTYASLYSCVASLLFCWCRVVLLYDWGMCEQLAQYRYLIVKWPADCMHWCSWKVRRKGFRSETTASLWDARKPGLSIRSVASCGH